MKCEFDPRSSSGRTSNVSRLGRTALSFGPFRRRTQLWRRNGLSELKILVGGSRGELLDHAIRTPIHPGQLMRRNQREDAMRRWVMGGTTWMDRGAREMRVDVTKGVDQPGRTTITLEFKAEGEGGARGSGTFREGDVPKRWRHLLTPDVLGAQLPVVF